jgi:protoheme IX farnesyltransferase
VTRAAGGRIRAYLELGKLRLSALAVFAVLAGLFLGAEQLPGPLVIAGTLIGTVLVAAGGNALNMFLERDTDPFMQRTEGRPLPSGRLRPGEVLGFGLVAGLSGLLLLWSVTNWIATALCAAIYVTYVLVYTPMKRRSTFNTQVGAIPGALPPVVGYAAGAGSLDERAAILFLLLFFWQVPHFLAIAWRYRDDYRAAGLRMLPVVDPAGRSTSSQMLVYASCMVLVSVLPSAPFVRMTGDLYLFVAILLGFVFLVSTAAAAFRRGAVAMRLCFLVSIIYLPLLFTVMVLDKIMLQNT